MSRRRLVAALAPVLAFALAGCGGGGASGSASEPSASVSPSASASTETPASPSPSESVPEPLVVHIKDFAYVPLKFTVKVGQPIVVINDDVMAHTWTATPKSGWTYDSGNMEKGDSIAFPGFTKPGTYPYLCLYHAEFPKMNGVATAVE